MEFYQTDKVGNIRLLQTDNERNVDFLNAKGSRIMEFSNFVWVVSFYPKEEVMFNTIEEVKKYITERDGCKDFRIEDGQVLDNTCEDDENLICLLYTKPVYKFKEVVMQEEPGFSKPEDGKPVNCVKCGELYNSAMPAISRIDNTTLICPNCGVRYA